MADQKNSNHIVRELKLLDVKEPDPSSLSVRELRGKNVKEELHTPSIGQPPPGPLCVHSTEQNLERKIFTYYCQSNQSTPASLSTILPQSSSDLDTDKGEIINEMLKQVVQAFNQMLCKTTTGNPASQMTPHMTILQTDNQPPPKHK